VLVKRDASGQATSRPRRCHSSHLKEFAVWLYVCGVVVVAVDDIQSCYLCPLNLGSLEPYINLEDITHVVNWVLINRVDKVWHIHPVGIFSIFEPKRINSQENFGLWLSISKHYIQSQTPLSSIATNIHVEMSKRKSKGLRIISNASFSTSIKTKS